MKMRVFTEIDAGDYWRLRLRALREEPYAFGQSVEEHLATTVEESALYLRNLPEKSLLLGLFDRNAAIGMLRFLREPGAKERHKGHLRSLFVEPAYRGRGLGSALLLECLRNAQEDSSLEQILLTVTASQSAAIQLYKKLGFEVFGTAPRALKIDGRYIDEHYMILNLPDRSGVIPL